MCFARCGYARVPDSSAAAARGELDVLGGPARTDGAAAAAGAAMRPHSTEA